MNEHWVQRLPEFNPLACRPLERLAEIDAEIAGLQKALEVMERKRQEQERKLEDWAGRHWSASEIARAKGEGR